MSETERLIAVLGYSDGTSETCHPISAIRVARAAEVTRADDVVLFSGAARRGATASEAALMAASWSAPACEVVLDEIAHSTFGNAMGAAASARALGVHEVVVVTSGWHARRATALFRAALRHDGTTVSTVATDETGTRRARFRELVCWALVPLQIAAAQKKRPS